MRKKLLLGATLFGLLAFAWAAWVFFTGGATELEEELEPSAIPAPQSVAGNSESKRRLDIRDAQNQAAAEFTVYYQSAEGARAIAGKDGWLHLPLLDSGPTLAAALAKGFWSAAAEVRAAPAPETVLRTVFEAAFLDLEVEVQEVGPATSPWLELHPLGTPAETQTANLYVEALSGGSFRFAGKDGSISVAELPPGSYRLQVGQTDCSSQEFELRLAPGKAWKQKVLLQEGAQVEGQLLLASSGTPIAGCPLALFPVSTTQGWADPLAVFRVYGIFPPQIQAKLHTRSDADGRFHFANVAPGPYRILAFAPGFLPYASPDILQCTPGKTHTAPTAKLENGHSLLLHIEDEQGQPLAHASVRWQLAVSSNLPHRAASAPAYSSEQGDLQLQSLPSQDVWLQVVHPNFAVLETQLHIAADAAPQLPEQSLQLFPGIDFSGRVYDQQNGEGLAGVSLKLLPQEGSAASGSGFAPGYKTEVQSQEGGTFEFHQVPPDTYLLFAHHQDYAPQISTPIPIDAQHHQSYSLSLLTGAQLEVELLDSKGTPQAQKWILVERDKPQSFVRARTDEEGKASFEHLAAGTYRVLQAESLATVGSHDLRIHQDYEYVTLLNQDQRQLLLGGRLPSIPLEGFVLAHGKAAPRRRVALLADDGTRFANTDASGFYQFQNLFPANYLFQVSNLDKPQDGVFYGSVMVGASSPQQRDILLPSASLRLQILDAASLQPVPYLPIRLRPADGTDLLGAWIQATDEKGMASFQTLREGSYLLCVGDAASPFADNDHPYGAVMKKMVINTQQPSSTIKLLLGQGATIRAHVEDAQGRPLEQVHLHYQNADGKILNPVSVQGTNSYGDALLTGLPTGPGFLIARHPQLGIQRTPIDLAPGQQLRLQVHLIPGSKVHVQVVDREGRPVPGVFVRLRDQHQAFLGDLRNREEQQQARLAVIRGTAQSFGPLPPGNYQLLLQRPGEEPISHNFQLPPGSQDLHLRLEY